MKERNTFLNHSIIYNKFKTRKNANLKAKTNMIYSSYLGEKIVIFFN